MIRVNLDEINGDLAAYLKRVENGETLILMRSDRPVAELRPLPSKASTVRPFGLCAGEFSVPDDFDAPLPAEILSEFEGR
jgi:antitoxin (DNA-binding transcriptional repressor) of toxin-antitoxin stability system